ncbi:MAG: M48 family metallopeptidase [Ignavibacteriales bacterium]|nr:MAG: M48 family metallopeptidase [Ignavibacteriales bacterium]
MAKWKDKADFKESVYNYAVKMEIKVKSLALRPMANKWASCSTDGNLNFNKELLDIDKKLGEYVIVHELLHFKVPNHGKLWKSLMRAYLGEYEKMEIKLKQIVSRQQSLNQKQKTKAPHQNK